MRFLTILLATFLLLGGAPALAAEPEEDEAARLERILSRCAERLRDQFAQGKGDLAPYREMCKGAIARAEEQKEARERGELPPSPLQQPPGDAQ